MSLSAGKLIEARSKEVQYVREKKVWPKITRREAQAQGWKIIKARWIDMNKGDDANPVYRSRLVGKEFNTGEMDGIFAGTPPLEAMRCLIHEAATIGEGQDTHTKCIMINDVAERFSRPQPLGECAWNCHRRNGRQKTGGRITSGIFG